MAVGYRVNSKRENQCRLVKGRDEYYRSGKGQDS
jgi:hypothetical protein